MKTKKSLTKKMLEKQIKKLKEEIKDIDWEYTHLRSDWLSLRTKNMNLESALKIYEDKLKSIEYVAREQIKKDIEFEFDSFIQEIYSFSKKYRFKLFDKMKPKENPKK